jgi:hypothetical protein
MSMKQPQGLSARIARLFFSSSTPAPDKGTELRVGDKVEFVSPQGYFERGEAGFAQVRIYNKATGKITRLWEEDARVDWNNIATEVDVPRAYLRKRPGQPR